MTQRALVLGSGGITGIAWEWGMLAGLTAAGVDLTDADLVVGTSAGSVVGTQVAAGLDVTRRYESQLEPPDGGTGATIGTGVLLRYGLAMVGPRAQVAARIGRYAARARTGTSAEDRVSVIEALLPVREWPDRALRITAVDVATGEFRVFDRDSGIPLVRAVAASCAVPGVWPPVPIDGRRYMDGGVRSGANADLAAGYERVVVIAPLTRGLGTFPDSEVEALRSESRVELVTPDAAALKAFGRNVLDPAKRADAARAGLAQSAAVVDQVRAVWTDPMP
ncbi:MAG: patatin-like phospholipase family protein [Actinophytocola sp.]|uniref:patatin-like phospholipase family protein n=1 Tax=Actinophytocola sp. TaxID=1872138 RepID=UPI00132C2EC5|nr:patatin-like phospholipase family protein [Actinophytocola sp.]MPZ82623.1 patatin-like phospholipase family protein [Actinophytocola sp.]